MNKYIDVNRLEFVITNYCTGSCKHCSIGEFDNKESIKPDIAVKIINDLVKNYTIDSIMTFGGEPLLHSDTVCKIHETAYKNNIQNRDIITNGYFTKNHDTIDDVVKNICKSNVKRVLLSVDAFHQESIPIEPVIHFAKSIIDKGFKGLKTHPAWLVNKEHKNKFNEITKEILMTFEQFGIESSNGNNIIPAGNAAKYLSEYFHKPDIDSLFVPCGTLPYTGNINELDTIFVAPNGDVMNCYFSIGNVYKKNILDIIEEYDPYNDPHTKLIAEGGVKKLYDNLVKKGTKINIDDCYTSCMVCKKIMNIIKEQKNKNDKNGKNST